MLPLAVNCSARRSDDGRSPKLLGNASAFIKGRPFDRGKDGTYGAIVAFAKLCGIRHSHKCVARAPRLGQQLPADCVSLSGVKAVGKRQLDLQAGSRPAAP